MSVLYLIEPQCVVHKEGERLVVKKGGDILNSIHIFKIQQVVVANNATLTTPVIKTLLLNEIDTVFISMSGRYYGRLQGPEGKNIVLRKALFTRHDNPEFSINFVKSVIKGKLRNQRTILARIQKNQKNLDMTIPMKKLQKIEDDIEKSQNIDEIRGHEGFAASIYFPEWGKGLKADAISFSTRQRRPPKDPVNALLSLGYTFLLHAVSRAVDICGLDPYLGFLHTIEYGRPSLVLDLMEEWRPAIVDSLVMSVFNLGVITKDDFMEYIEEDEEKLEDKTSKSGLRLNNGGWRKFVGQYERKLNDEVTHHIDGLQRSYRDTLLAQARYFVQHVKGETDEYLPFLIR